MEIYGPKQRADGRYDYTCSNSGGIYAIGYCFNGPKPFYALSWNELSDIVKSLYYTEERWEQVKAEHAPRLSLYHNDGHATAEEAIACYRRYEVLEYTRRHEDKSSKQQCQLCEEWTQHRVTVGTSIPTEYVLCPGCDTEANILHLHIHRGQEVAA